MERERLRLMKHFYNIINKYIDKTDLETDIFTLKRKQFVESGGVPIKEKFTVNSDECTRTYDIAIELGKALKWNVTENGKNVTTVKELDTDKYSLSFFKEGNLFKKYTFSLNHVFKSLEYYDRDNNAIPICTFEPRMSKSGLVVVYNRQGSRDMTVLYPVSFSDDEYINKKIEENYTDYIVKANTDDGIIIFLSDEQKVNYLKCLEEIKDEVIKEEMPESFIDEDDISLGKMLEPHLFNTKRNLANNIDISAASEFMSDEEEKEEENKEKIALVPDKIIGNDVQYMYYGDVNENGNRDGYGRTAIFNGKTAYEGGYKDDKRDGSGSYYYKDGSLCYSGEWKNNKRNGVGVGISSRDKSIHVGTWKDNLPCGNGVRLNGDGTIKFIRKDLSQGGYIKITFGHNDSVVLAQYDENDKLMATKGFSKI